MRRRRKRSVCSFNTKKKMCLEWAVFRARPSLELFGARNFRGETHKTPNPAPTPWRALLSRFFLLLVNSEKMYSWVSR